MDKLEKPGVEKLKKETKDKEESAVKEGTVEQKSSEWQKNYAASHKKCFFNSLDTLLWCSRPIFTALISALVATLCAVGVMLTALAFSVFCLTQALWCLILAPFGRTTNFKEWMENIAPLELEEKPGVNDNTGMPS